MDYNNFLKHTNIVNSCKLIKLVKFWFVKKWIISFLNFKDRKRIIEFLLLYVVAILIILINGVHAIVILFNILARLYNCRCVALTAHIRLDSRETRQYNSYV